MTAAGSAGSSNTTVAPAPTVMTSAWLSSSLPCAHWSNPDGGRNSTVYCPA